MNKLALDTIGQQFFGSASNNPLANSNSFSGVGKAVSLFLNIAFVGAGLALLFFFIIGGIGLIGSAGKSDPQKTEQSKKTLTSALVGFVIVFASYWIVKLIGQLLGVSDLIF